jgi:large subunit ribosomal protein L35
MPKIKTKRGAAKRFKRTGKGKIVSRHANASHILTKKTTKRKRHLRKSAVLTGPDAKRVRRMIPGI